MKNKKAISPVIATVILVAVAVAIAIAVAFWASGLAGTFTRFEKLDFTSAFGSNLATSPDASWNITCIVSNTGSSDATITQIYINGKPLTSYGANASAVDAVDAELPFTLPTGTTQYNIIVWIRSGSGSGLFTPGQTVDIKLHTASGTDYPKSVVLP